MEKDLGAFIRLMREQFDQDRSMVNPEQAFRDLGEWSSMQALIVITVIDEAYGVTIGEERLREARTFEDLFTLVKSL